MGVIITSPSRLHLSLIDLNGALGRVDGGIGVALNDPFSKIEVSEVDREEVEKEGNPKEVIPILEGIKRSVKLRRDYRVRILNKLPAHVGLGSQTQLSLSVAKAIAVLEDRSYSTVELARLVRRGGTSGIGVAAFDRGGFILDGGHSFLNSDNKKENRSKEFLDEKSKEGIKTSFLPSSASNVPPPPVLFQQALPEDWFFVVTIPDVKRGAHGIEEVENFKRYCPIKEEEVEKVCRIVLMKILPSVLEKDIESFAKNLTMLQGTGFKKIEVGLQHGILKELFSFFEDRALGHGMSSFGPTTYALVEGEKRAKELASEAKEFLEEKGFRSFVTYSNANNRGTEVRE